MAVSSGVSASARKEEENTKLQKCKNGSKHWRSTAQPQDCWKTTCHVALKPPPAHEGGMYQGRNTMRALSCFSPWQDAQPNASPMSNSAGSWGLPKPARYPLPPTLRSEAPFHSTESKTACLDTREHQHNDDGTCSHSTAGPPGQLSLGPQRHVTHRQGVHTLPRTPTGAGRVGFQVLSQYSRSSMSSSGCSLSAVHKGTMGERGSRCIQHSAPWLSDSHRNINGSYNAYPRNDTHHGTTLRGAREVWRRDKDRYPGSFLISCCPGLILGHS